jgi:hypothetical protein
MYSVVYLGRIKLKEYTQAEGDHYHRLKLESLSYNQFNCEYNSGLLLTLLVNEKE